MGTLSSFCALNRSPKNVIRTGAMIAASLLVWSETAAQAAGPLRPFQVGLWSGGAWTNDQTGTFSHCAVGVNYNSGILSRRSRNQTGRHAAHAEPPRPYGRFWMIRRYTSARFVPADAGAKDKNPMGSMLFSASIIASSLPECHQILRTSCQESVRK
jgi:hypothetical protein